MYITTGQDPSVLAYRLRYGRDCRGPA